MCVLQLITGPPNGPVLFCWLASVVVCNAVNGRAGRPSGAWTVGRPTLHGGLVRLRLLRATPCLYRLEKPVVQSLSTAAEGFSSFGYNALKPEPIWTKLFRVGVRMQLGLSATYSARISTIFETTDVNWCPGGDILTKNQISVQGALQTPKRHFWCLVVGSLCLAYSSNAATSGDGSYFKS